LKQISQHIVFCLLFSLGIPFALDAQTDFKSQDDMKKKANEYFKEEDYVSAMPLYSQLVSIYPKDPVYNYRFGVCVLYADRRETEKPIQYMEFASSKHDVDVSVFYYLGLAYHHNYRFAEAIKEYNLYKEKAGIKNAAKMDVDRQIEICDNARNLLTHFSDLYVLQKTEVDYKDFFRSYDAEQFIGRLLVKPDIFKTPLDRKREKLSLVYFSKENNEVYFSSYGIDGKNGKDIYKSTKLPDGEWSKPVNLGTTINTPYDEDFPFILPDGVTLYYCSKGMNTIGGYDIFKSALNDDGAWSTPENLNYPINTPFDDIMFMPDSSQQYAYFSSSRSSIEGMITVYKVRIDKRPQVNEILVLNKNTNIPLGNDTAYAQTIQFLKENANLAVNATESMFAEEENKNDTIQESVNNKNNVSEEYEYKIPENITNDDIIKIADKQSKDALQELNELKIQRNAAKIIAQNRKLQAEAKYNEADSITKIAETISDVNTKQTELVKVNMLHSEAEQLNKESAIATNIADQLGEKVNIKLNEANEALSYANQIKTAVKSNSIDTSIAILNKMIDNLEKSPVDTSISAFNNPNKEFIKLKEQESQTLAEQAKQTQDEVNSLKSEADNYRKDAADSKKKSVKEQLDNKVVELDDEAKTKQVEADQILQKSEKLQSEADSARAQSTIYANVVDDIKNNNTTYIAVTTHTAIADNTITENTNIKTNSQIVVNYTKPTNEELKHKAEVQTKTENIVKAVQKEADDLKKQADIAYTIASDKNNQSIKMSKEADNFTADASEIANTDDKEKSINKANELRQESIVFAQQSVVAYNLAKKIEVAYNEKQQEAIGIVKKSADIKELTDLNKINEAETKYSELQSSIVPQTNTPSVTDQFQFEQANLLDNKEYELQQATEDCKLLQSKTDSLLDKSNSLRKEADNTNMKSKKNELIKQAEQIEVQETAIRKQLNEANDLSSKFKIEVEELKIKIKYTANLITEASIYKASDTSTINKAELGKQISQYETEDIFAETNTEKTNDIIAKNETETQLTETVNNSVSNSNDESAISNLTVAEKAEIKADFIDNTIAVINNNISVLQNNMAKENNQIQKEKISKEISDLQKEAVTLKQQADETHKEAVKINGSKVVEPISSIDKKIFAQNLDNESDSSFKRAAEKRIEANKTNNIAQKEKLYTEAKKFEENAQIIQLEALEIYGIADKNMYYKNSLKIGQIKVTDETNNQLSIAELLENESRYYFEKAEALRENVKNETNYTKKKPILEEAKTDEQLAIEKQLNAIDIYTKAAPAYAQTNATSTLQPSNITQANTESVNERLQSELANSLNGKEYELQQANENYILFQAKTDSLSNVVKSLKQKAGNTTNQSDKNEFIKLAEQIEAQINDLQVQLNEADNLSEQLKIEIEGLKLKIKNTNNLITEASINNKVADLSSTNTTKLIATNITKTEFKGIYINNDNTVTLDIDTANLVPLNPKLPAGIIFKVQIAAVKNHVAPNVFEGITPLTGEITATGLIRYLAGLFAKFEDANTARNQIRTMGYADAFVVAYYNGKRISVAEALAMLKNDNSLTTTYADLNNKTYITASPNINTTAGLSNPIANIKGFLYSVQVGVYGSPRTSAQLFNITPLYDEVMANGYYRYLSGIYSSLKDAVTAKNAIVVRGVKDAFVVVYNNGNKITMAEAETLLTENATLAGITNTIYETTATQANTTEIIDKSGIVYKVQLGAYKNDVPVDVVNQFLDNIAGNNLEHNMNNDGLTVYTSGNFKDYDSANNFKNTLVSKGMKDAFVVAFQNGQKISVTKAIELLK